MKLSTHQDAVLSYLRANGGKLVRYAGGFWAAPSNDYRNFWTDIRTVRAMERKGTLRRVHEYEAEWSDPRVLVEETK